MMLPDVIKRSVIPSDPSAVAMITRQKIYADRYAWTFTRRQKNAQLTSSHVWLRRSHEQRVDLISKSIVGDVARYCGVLGRFPCVTAGSDNSDTMLREKKNNE